MGMVDGSIRASTQVRFRAVFQPPGLTGSLANRRVEQKANVAIDPYGFGTDDAQCDTLVLLDKAIPAGTSVTYDLYTGTDLPDLDDDDAPFRAIKFVQISIEEGGDESGVRVGGAASNEWVGYFVAAGDQQDIFPGGPPYMAGDPEGDGKAVTSTTKNLKIENRSASSVTVRIAIGGNRIVPGMWMGFGLWTYP